MISDVLSDAAARITEYLENPATKECYQGRDLLLIQEVLTTMNIVRERLDTVPNSYIKSITTTQHACQWVCRVRFTQGGEQFIGAGANYTLHQAEKLTQSVRRDIARHGAAVLDQYVAA